MADKTGGSVARQLTTLWSVGTVGQADDQALLAAYCAGRDGTAEAAFRVLVERHGPMVVRVCRGVLGDGHDALDAAQAVFLVLARKADSIRGRGSVAPWLLGVACRVARKARRRAAVRRRNESAAAIESARDRAATAENAGRSSCDDEALHAEIARLPEKYRTPVVLCDLEGLTYEETARRLACPVGTVRSRLSRAREKLRGRLAGKGFGPGAAAFELPKGWVESTARLAHLFVTGRSAESGAVSGPALALGREFLRAMMMTKLKFAAAGLIATGAFAAGGHALVGQQPQPQSVPPAAATKEAVTAPVDPEQDALQRYVKDCRLVLRAQRARYEGGETLVSDYLDASLKLSDAEAMAATTKEQRVAAARTHVDLCKTALSDVEAKLKTGQASNSSVTEAKAQINLAQLRLIRAEKNGGPGDYASLDRRLNEVEQKLDRVINLLNLLAPGDKGPARVPR